MGWIFSHKATSISNNSRDLYRTEVEDEPGSVRRRTEEMKRNGHEINCYVPSSEYETRSATTRKRRGR